MKDLELSCYNKLKRVYRLSIVKVFGCLCFPPLRAYALTTAVTPPPFLFD